MLRIPSHHFPGSCSTHQPPCSSCVVLLDWLQEPRLPFPTFSGSQTLHSCSGSLPIPPTCLSGCWRRWGKEAWTNWNGQPAQKDNPAGVQTLVSGAASQGMVWRGYVQHLCSYTGEFFLIWAELLHVYLYSSTL